MISNETTRVIDSSRALSTKPEKEEIPCPLCGAHDFTKKYDPWVSIEDPIKLYGAASSISGTQTIVTCNQCELIYENPRYPDSVISAGYEAAIESGHDTQYPMRVNSFFKALQRIKAAIPASGAKVLDVGTAGGAFLEAAKQYGYHASGLEPCGFLVEQGKRRGLDIVQGTIDSHNLQENSFDMICFWDVIEHLSDPASAVEKAKRLLKPGGVLLLNYPDIGTWQAKVAGKRFWWIISGHLVHFSRGTISKLCAKAGMKAFYFRRYWQVLEFGYLELMAAHLGMPLAKFIHSITPEFIRKISVPYYASQTTMIARVES